MITRKIPRTGEELPVIGLGTWQTFKGKSLPAWARELDCTSWAQFFLKFIVGHPAESCPIPATAKPAHVADNVRAGYGRLPDEKQRAKMRAVLEAA